MKNKLLLIITTVILISIPKINFGQAPALGTVADFVLFSTVGAVGNTGISHLTGNVGTNNGLSTGFGNVNGGMHDNDGISSQCAADLLIAYNQLNATIPTFFPAPLLGNGQILIAGVYSVSGAATMNLDLILDAQGNPNAVFIIKISGPLSTNANSKVKLINGALACNVYWKVEGLVSMASGTSMKGTIIANNAAINMNTGDTLEGRALSTSGAVTIDGVLAYTPIGCGSPTLSGPDAPTLASTECYVLFSSTGPATNSGITYLTGDVGTNSALTTGFNPLFVAGTIHTIADGSTAACAADLLNVNTYLAALPDDIELLYPAQFGNNLVLTPHAYIMNGAVSFTDTLYLNAMGNSNAVFTIKVYGAFSTSTYSKVILINGAQSKNIFWNIHGAVDINDYSEFKGTIICNNGAIDLNTGVDLDGRALTTTGALNTTAILANMPIGCSTLYAPSITNSPINDTTCVGSSAIFHVTANGSGLTYQWRKGLVNLVNGGNISGATSATLNINPANALNAGTNYNVVVTGTMLPTVTSSNITLVVNTSPTIGYTVLANDTVCPGATVTLTGTGGTSYSWSGGITNAIAFTPASSNSYIVTGTGNLGCTATATASIVVGTIPFVNLGANIIQLNPPVTLDAGPGYTSYIWSNAASTQTITVNTNGTYIVSVTNVFGCTDIDTVQVNFTTGIINYDGSISMIALYPNPTTGPVNLSIENLETENLVIDILDITGVIVTNKYIGSVNGNLIEPFDFTGLRTGTYIIRLTANGTASYQRFIVNK